MANLCQRDIVSRQLLRNIRHHSAEIRRRAEGDEFTIERNEACRQWRQSQNGRQEPRLARSGGSLQADGLTSLNDQRERGRETVGSQRYAHILKLKHLCNYFLPQIYPINLIPQTNTSFFITIQRLSSIFSLILHLSNILLCFFPNASFPPNGSPKTV